MENANLGHGKVMDIDGYSGVGTLQLCYPIANVIANVTSDKGRIHNWPVISIFFHSRHIYACQVLLINHTFNMIIQHRGCISN